MQVDANSIKQGHIIQYQDKLWMVAKQPVHTKPGKGGAFIQLELKDILSGTKLNERFRSTETLDKIRLDEIEMQYLYHDDSNITLMDMESFEQIEIKTELLGDDKLPFLADGVMLTVEFHEETPLKVSLPDMMIFKVEEAEAVVKGQTAASSSKPAILENGIRIMVPPFIESGTKVVVRTEDSSYVERAKD